MISLRDIRSFDDVDTQVRELTAEIARIYTGGRPDPKDIQGAAVALAQLQLALNDLERREVCEGTPSREMAGRSVDLERRIRMARRGLDEAMRFTA